MALVLVKNFPDRMYAERARQTLAESGIPAIIQAPDSGILGAGGATGLPQGADLYVEEEFAAESHQMLDELFDGI